MWQMNRNVKREMEMMTAYSPIFTEVSAGPYQIREMGEIIGVQENKELYSYNALELPIGVTGEFK